MKGTLEAVRHGALMALIVLSLQAVCTLPALGQPAASTVVLHADTADARHKLGSAFAVRPGVFATAYHLVSGAVRIRLEGPGGEPVEATLRAYSAEADVALLDAPALSGMRPLTLEDRIPAEREPLLAVGARYSLAPSPGDATALMGGLMPLSEFVTPDGAPLFANPPDLSALLFEADLPVGVEGGPLIARSGEVVGLIVSGLGGESPNGWATPASEVTALLGRPPQTSPLAQIAWPSSPYDGPSFHVEIFVSEDTEAVQAIAAFPTDAARLRAANQELVTNLTGRGFAMTSLADKLDAALAGNPTLARVNAAGTREMVFLPAARSELTDTAQALETRARLDAALRRTVSRLEALARRTDLDVQTATRLRTASRSIVRTGNSPAAQSYEARTGADAAAIATDLRALAAHPPRFASLADARDFAARLRRAANALQQYEGSDFSVWMSQEDSYFSRAERVLRSYGGAIVYRPEG